MGIQKNQLKQDQRGVVAIVVTMFFMIVLTLVVLAFSQAARREQRQTLDNQLTKQAFYAAESGINDTMQKLVTDTTMPEDNFATGCTNNTNVVGDGVITYSCVLYDKEPEDIRIDSIDVNNGETISLSTSGVTQLDNIDIYWRDNNPGSNYAGCNPAGVTEFEATEPDCNAGILRVYLMKWATDREALVSNSFSVFLRPSTPAKGVDSVGYVAYGAGNVTNNQGKVIPAKCTNGGECHMRITGIGGGENYIHIRSVGKSNSVRIVGTNQFNTILEYDKAQALIDSTGKANDVLRRLQVRKPLAVRNYSSSFSIDALDGICKQLQVYPGSATYNNCFTDPLKGPTGIQ